MPVEYYDEKGEQLNKITFHAAYRVEIGKEGRCKLLKKVGANSFSKIANGSKDEVITAMRKLAFPLSTSAVIRNNNREETKVMRVSTCNMETADTREDDVVESIMGAQGVYYDYNKQECLRQSIAVWRVYNNTLEMRKNKTSWQKIHTSGRDVKLAISGFMTPKEYYYDYCGYPLGSVDTEFASTKFVEFENGLALKFRRTPRQSEWRQRNFVKEHLFSRFKYLGADFKETKRGEDSIKFRLSRIKGDRTHALCVDTFNYDGTWKNIGNISGFNVEKELESLLIWPSKSEYYSLTGEKCDSIRAAYKKVITVPNIQARLYKSSEYGWRLVKIGTIQSIDTYISSIASSKAEPNTSMGGAIDVSIILKESKDTAQSFREIKSLSNDTQSENEDAGGIKAEAKAEIEEPNANSDMQGTRATEAQSNIAEPSITESDTLEKIYSKVNTTTNMTKEELNSYIKTCLWRNRKAKYHPIINTRLVDRLNQPIYVYDYGYMGEPKNIDMTKIYTVDSIAQARSLCTDTDITSMPGPLQWSDNPYDYIWNPSISISPISITTLDILEQSKDDVFHPLLRGKDIIDIMGEVKTNCKYEEAKACRDISYALPYYNKDRDTVSMMLPLRIKLLSGNKVLNALVFERNLLGYSLYKVITVEEAIRSVRLFRDPSMTWLMGG